MVVEDGTVFLFDLFGTPVSQFGLGQDARDATVTDCFVWGTGLVALTANLKLIAVTGGFDNPRPRTLASAGFQQPPTSWTVLPPHQSPTGDVEVFVAVDKTIFTVSASKAQNQLLSNGPFSRMAISPNGKLLLTASDTKLWVVSIDFQRSIREFPLEKPRIPDSISWCGTDAVAACWAKERTLTVASVAGGHASFDVGGFAVLVPEVDGCRVVTDERCEFLQRLPSELIQFAPSDSWKGRDSPPLPQHQQTQRNPCSKLAQQALLLSYTTHSTTLKLAAQTQTKRSEWSNQTCRKPSTPASKQQAANSTLRDKRRFSKPQALGNASWKSTIRSGSWTWRGH